MSQRRAHRSIKVERDSALYHGFGILPGEPIEWQHDPPLNARAIVGKTPEGRNLYWPDENDPTHLRPLRVQAHKDETYGTNPATIVGSDRHLIDHTKRLEKNRDFHRRVMAAKAEGEPRPRQKDKRAWPKRSMRRKQEARP